MSTKHLTSQTGNLTVNITAKFTNRRALRALILAMRQVEEMCDGQEWNAELMKLHRRMRIAAKGIGVGVESDGDVILMEDE